MVRERMQMNQRHRAVAANAISKVAQWLVNMDPQTLKPADAAKWFEVAVRVQREASGLLVAEEPIPGIPDPDDDPTMPAGTTLAEALGIDGLTERSTDRELLILAARIVKENERAAGRLAAIAGREGVTLEDGLSEAGLRVRAELKALEGAAFDRAYLAALYEGPGHVKGIAKIMRVSKKIEKMKPTDD